MFVKAIKCEECNSTVYSRAREDVRECECGRVMVYGGFLTHFKYDIKDKKAKFKTIKMNIQATPADLYNDYENMEDKFGLIKQKTKETNSNYTL